MIRTFIPNTGQIISDAKIMDMINALRPKCENLISFKRKVGMIFHQALKEDRAPLINKILNNTAQLSDSLVASDIKGTINNAKESLEEVATQLAQGKTVDWKSYKPIDAGDVEEELRAFIKPLKDKPMGAIMGQVMGKYKGKIDGKQLSALIMKLVKE